MIIKIILLAASYLLGAIPSGYIITKKLKGFDIRDHGSGNPGAANVYRVVGKWPGVATFACDALKGAAVVLAAKYLLPRDIYTPMACGFIAICAHMWTIFLKLRGGKGVATSAGVFGALLPAPTALAFLTFGLIVWRTGRISPGSIAAAVVLPATSYFIGANPPPYCVLATVVCALVIYKHIPNIKRMFNKEELKFEDGSKKNAAK
ncbi:MAG: glycerol-3-phosphate 1-O-acyltransferase PlsY [Elusimicrobiota bacterium]|jgi:glycerol-3-phosphate acyltransferase PlsY|nr:glycerol-3-phosphate 1-O-acyltransferase PlsY [Elusimicrobiota bacterium]